MAGTLSAEDVGDENIQRGRSPLGSDKSDNSPPASLGRNSPDVRNTNLMVPRQGLRRFLTPSIAASTPDLRTAQENELKNSYDPKMHLSNKNLNANWLSSQSISNLSVSNYEINISRAGSDASSGFDKKSQDLIDAEMVHGKRNSSEMTEKGESKKKRDYLTIPFLHGKKKKSNLALSTPDISNALGDLKNSKSLAHSNFYLDRAGNENANDGPTLAQQHGLDLEMYKNILEPSKTINGAGSNRVTDKHVEYTFGTAVFSVWLKNGSLSLSIKKLSDLPYKGTTPRQYSVLVKMQILPENKKVPIRYAGSNGDKKSPNPVFEEEFHWTNLGSLATKTLCISVYERGRQGNYDAIGHTMLHIGTANLDEQPRMFSSSLKSSSAPSNSEGSIQLSLDYRSAGGKEIEICAYHAKGLQINHIKSQEPLSTFVKASFYVNGKKVKSRRSAIVKEEDPFYNHTFKFAVPSDASLTDSLVVVSVVHKIGKLSSEQLIGKVLFGPYCFLKGVQTDWGNAILKGQKITRWYDLQVI